MSNNPVIRSGLFVEDIDVYHSTKAIGSTHLRTFIKSPAKFWHVWNNGYDMPESEALRIGSAVHCKILEPEDFNKRYIEEPEINKRTIIGREQAAEFKELNSDKTVLSKKEWEITINASKSIIKDETAYNLLKDTKREMSARVRLSNGLIVQCRPDAIKQGHILDLKTCVDVSKFKNDIRYNNYHIQAAFYYFILSSIIPDLYKDSDFYFVAIEKSPPFECKTFALTNENLVYLVDEYVKPNLVNISTFLHSGPQASEVEWVDVL